jgi:bifunctional non-homologous end joining protein LigD
MSAVGVVATGSKADQRAAQEALDALEAIQDGGNHVVRVSATDIKLSNVDKVMYPETGFTKLDVAHYYATVSPVLLPHLRHRALTLKRYPHGVDGKFFYQKRSPEHRPDWVHTESLQTDERSEPIDYTIPEDVRALIWLSSLADIELHVLLSRDEDVHSPTSMVFDLDPGEGSDVTDCARVALLVHDLFDDFGLETVVKTSGSKGLQVYVPLNDPKLSYELTKPFAKGVAQLLERDHPDLVVHKMLKTLRKGKVLVDWSQNDDHKTTVCAYSLRARPEPTVSTPVTWDEVSDALDAGDPDALKFRYSDIPSRIGKHGDLMEPVLELQQELPELVI